MRRPCLHLLSPALVSPAVISPALALCFAASLCAQTAAPSQIAGQPQSPASPAPGGPALSQPLAPALNSPDGLIKLDVVVTDKSGKPVAGLGSQDFTLLDNGQPNRILSFRAFDGASAKPDPPVEVILLIDSFNISGYMASHAKEEIERFLRRNGGQLAQPVSVYVLGNPGVWLAAGPSTDGNAVAEELARNRDPHLTLLPHLVVNEQIKPATRALMTLGEVASMERQKPGRKLLVWVGPGSGIGSGANSDQLQNQQQLFDLIVWFSTLLREARISVYSTSVGKVDVQQELYRDFLKGVESTPQANFGNLYRDVLAVQSGGSVPDPRNDLAAEIDSSVQQANTFYTLSFNPSRADHLDEYHNLKVQLSDPDLNAQTNTGYYDQPYYSYQPNPAIRRVTVEELEQLLQAERGNDDEALAQQLSSLELTERLSGAKLSTWTARLRGEKSRRALAGLADMSAFLDLPSAEVRADPPPSPAEQRRIIAMAGGYLNKSIPMLPDFFARRTATLYSEGAKLDVANERVEFETLHLLDRSNATVLYRKDREVVDAGAEKTGKQKPEDPNLTTYGTFGPALGLMSDILAAPDGMTWSRWEQGASGLDAVFRYRIPLEKSRYRILGCCLPDGDGTEGFAVLAGYHGEMKIDPASGAILHLEVQADVKGFLPILRSGFIVAYGPVQIGGNTYICPVKSVSVMTMRSVRLLSEWEQGFRTYGPYGTALSDFTFGEYHMFRSSSRILPPNPHPPEN